MPAILASSFHDRMTHKLRKESSNRARKINGDDSCLGDNVSYESVGSSTDDSVTSFSSISSFLTQFPSMLNHEILDSNSNNWGYFVDATTENETLEQLEQPLGQLGYGNRTRLGQPSGQLEQPSGDPGRGHRTRLGQPCGRLEQLSGHLGHGNRTSLGKPWGQLEQLSGHSGH